MEFQNRYFALCFLVIEKFEWFWIEILHKLIHLMLESWINTLMGFLTILLCNIGIYADDTNLYSKFDQVSDLG